MKFDRAKAWPHPVCRPSYYGDDYPDADFEVDTEMTMSRDGRNIEMRVDFELSDPDLLRLIGDGRAAYMVIVRSPRSHFRHAIESCEATIREQLSGGYVSGRTEVAPFVVCRSAIDGCSFDGWHSDYAGLSFDFPPGTVLAEDVPKEYWIDTANETPLGSVFAHQPRPGMDRGRWECDLEGDYICIVMSIHDSKRYEAARERADGRPEAQYLMNSLYLPALLAALCEPPLFTSGLEAG